MTFEEIRQIPDLQVNVTPAVEDAFHFLYGLEKSEDNMTDAQRRCGQHLEAYSENERLNAIHEAYRMLDNIAKYGIPCAAWA